MAQKSNSIRLTSSSSSPLLSSPRHLRKVPSQGPQANNPNSLTPSNTSLQNNSFGNLLSVDLAATVSGHGLSPRGLSFSGISLGTHPSAEDLLNAERVAHSHTQHLVTIKETRVQELQKEVMTLRARAMQWDLREEEGEKSRTAAVESMAWHKRDVENLKEELRLTREGVQGQVEGLRQALLAVMTERDELVEKTHKYEAVLQSVREEGVKLRDENKRLRAFLERTGEAVSTSQQSTPVIHVQHVPCPEREDGRAGSPTTQHSGEHGEATTAQEQHSSLPQVGAPSADALLGQYNFILESRTGFVTDVWGLYQVLQRLRRDAQQLKSRRKCGAQVVPAPIVTDLNDLANVISDATQRIHWIVCNYVTDTEKHFLGASPSSHARDFSNARPSTVRRRATTPVTTRSMRFT